MKKPKPKLVRTLYWVGLAIGAAVALYGMSAGRAREYGIASIAILLGDRFLYTVFYRCPHCGKYLDRSGGVFCPHCGKDVNEV